MSARGILQNPGLFAGFERTPVSCVEDWLALAMESGMPFVGFHHHLMFMLEKILDKAHRRTFNSLKDTHSVVKFLCDYFNIKTPPYTNLPTNHSFVDFPTEPPNILPFTDLKTTEANKKDFLEDSQNLYKSQNI